MPKPKKPNYGKTRPAVIDGEAVLLDGGGRKVETNWHHIPYDIKYRRRAFLLEYIKDFNGTKAAMRCNQGGDTSLQCTSSSGNWLREPYTQWLLCVIIQEQEEDCLVNRKTIIAGLVKEAFTAEESSTRVKALETLGKIKGMFTIKVENTTNNNGGVMMLPNIDSLEKWEEHSRQQQTKLKSEAMTEA